jgi:hypothetical protein
MSYQDQLVQGLSGVLKQMQGAAWTKTIQAASSNDQTLEAALEKRLNLVVGTLQAYNPVTQSIIDMLIANLNASAAQGVPTPQQTINLIDSFTSVVDLAPAPLLTANQAKLMTAWSAFAGKWASPGWRQAFIAAGSSVYSESQFSYAAADNCYDELVTDVLSDFVTQMNNLQAPIQQGIQAINNDITKLAGVSAVLTDIGNVLDLLAQALAVAAKF